ncbi:AAA domain-containing protein [Terribacillus sp. JSM ZJ617]|uniref:serine/threonine-protein kinase n=1 Tax=Terribacillus sp. JSM ZJ617 TaxID=3342119 RepID=UPI0035A892FA
MQIIDNKYEIINKVASTEKSTVYKGHIIKSQRKVTIKLLSHRYNDTNSKDLNEIFYRDSRALSMISHANIIEYIDSGVNGDSFYIVMEDFNSQTLKAVVEMSSLSFEEKMEIMIQISKGVQAAHDKRIIHRDLKPTNILVNSELKVKVIDFGISKIMDIYANRTGHTLKDYISKRYASPEYLLGEQLDFSSDVYSLGSIFYYLITESEPPEDKKALYNDIEALFVSDNVKSILKKSLAFDKNNRYRSVISFTEELHKEIEQNTVQGNLKLVIPRVINRNLQDIGKVSNPRFNTVKNFIENSLVEANIYKTEKNYYLIGEGIKYQVIPDLKNGFISVFKVFTIDKYHENEFERGKGIEVQLNLDIVDKRTESANDISELVKFISKINENFEMHKQKKSNNEKTNKLLAEWMDVISIQKRFNFNRERIGNYSNVEYDNSNNFLTVNMDSNSDLSMLQDGDHLRLQGKNSNLIKVGPIKNVNNNIISVALLPDVEFQEVSMRGEARVDTSVSNQMLKRYSNALRSLINNESVNRNLLDYLISPEQLSMKSVALNLEFVNKSIDIANKSAVIKGLQTNDIFLIQGPPGTGKSTVITELVNQIFLENSKSKVLITSPSHVAVDHLLKNIVKTQSDKRIVRVGTSEKISKDATNLLATEQLKQWAMDVNTKSISQTVTYLENNNPNDKTLRKYIQHRLIKNPHIKTKDIDMDVLDKNTVDLINVIRDWNNRLELLDEFDDIFAREASIVAATCVGIASRHTLRNLTYDWVIIDEAARATAPELILPMLLGKKIILVGDHKQLPPIVNIVKDKGLENQIDTSKLEKSLFEDIFEDSAPEARVTLTSQFRMHPVISDLVNKSFYQTYKIKTKVSEDKRKHHLDFEEVVLWLDTSALPDKKEERINNSFRNSLEVRIIKKELERINSIYFEKNIKASVAIISGYNAQKQLLLNSIEPKNEIWTNLQIQIDNIDAFQGSESDIVFYSLVRSNERFDLGFLRDQRRINVALSRGKNGLYIIGDKECVLNSSVKQKEGFAKVLQFISRTPQKCIIKGARL